MSAQPAAPDPDDPVEILRVLPAEYHAQFRAEYAAAAMEAAHSVEGYRALHDMLRLWRLRSIAYTAPGAAEALAEAQEAARTGNWEGSVPIEDLIPDWPGFLAAARRRR